MNNIRLKHLVFFHKLLNVNNPVQSAGKKDSFIIQSIQE